MHLMLHKLSTVLGVQLLEIMVACGVDPQALKQSELEDNPDPKNRETDTTLIAERKVQAKLKLDAGLSAVTGTFSLVSCTGHVDANFDSGKISLPETAVGCRIAIASLSMDGHQYKVSETDPEWKTGDTLHFTATDGTLLSLAVKIDHQLSSTPQSNEIVSFTVSRSDAAGASQSKTLLAAGMEGSLAPYFKIRKTEFVGLTSEGAGQFVFHLDCLRPVAAGEGREPTCNGLPISSIHYQLVKDDFNSELSYDDAVALFTQNVGESVNIATDFEPFKAEKKQYGGFQTNTGNSILQGPGHIHENPHMILLLQGPGPSYQYFNVDVVFSAS